MTTAAVDIDAMTVRDRTALVSVERAFRSLAVTDPAHPDPVIVRWRIKVGQSPWRWKCDLHGTGHSAGLCAHTIAAAMYLTRDLLGADTRLDPEGITPHD